MATSPSPAAPTSDVLVRAFGGRRRKGGGVGVMG